MAKPGDHWVNFDLKDGFYSLTMDPKDREAVVVVNLDVKLLQFCALPMYGLEPQPLRLPKARGGLYGPPSRPGIDHFPFDGILCHRSKAWTKTFKAVALPLTPPHKSPASILRRRLLLRTYELVYVFILSFTPYFHIVE
jgi:hypothetical protein